MKLLRVAVVCDFLEEEWPSMDTVGETLFQSLNIYCGNELEALLIRPPFVRRLGRISGVAMRSKAFSADRALNRIIDYPKFIRQIRKDFDIFHIVDHSYSHLVHHLPHRRTV